MRTLANTELRYMTTSKFYWPTQRMTGGVISAVQPFTGRLPTPGTVRKMIAIEKSFTKEIWVPPSNKLGDLSSKYNASPSHHINVEKLKGKFYAKMARNKKRKEQKSQIMKNLGSKLVGEVDIMARKLS
jgi:hypothetical protein